VTATVAVLDEDHVLRMVAGVLAARTAADWSRVGEFFAPDVAEPAALDVLRQGVTLAGPGDPATALLLRRGRVDRAELAARPGLRLVQRLGSRRDGIDLAAVRDAGIEVSCLPRPSLVRTAEHTLLLVLALTKRLLVADRAVRSGAYAPVTGAVAYNWAGLTGLGGLHGRILGVVGLGEVGRLVAARALAFGMTVRYSGRRLAPEQERALGVEHRSLPDLLGGSDAVTLHVPGTVAAPVLGRAEIAAMRPGALLVNTGRGRLVDEDALYDALVAGHLAGAGLDVHACEPRPRGDRFCDLDSVVLTPHIAGGSRLEVLDEVRLVFENVRSVAAGAAPPHGRVEP
jgi:phosphoglycerate dehydrogenase-like enzyme